MCGLVGVFGENLQSKDEEAFKDGLIASQLRGQASTGIGVVRGKKLKASFLKAAADATAFVNDRSVKEFFGQLHGARVLMGHTRWPTTGAINNRNAHPFLHGHILLAHNGGVWNKEYIDRENRRKFDVDSEAFAYMVSQIGLTEALRKAHGGFALSFVDTNAKTFTLFRDNTRPLFWTKRKHADTYYYASEPGILHWVLGRNDLEHGEIRNIGVDWSVIYDFKTKSITERRVNYSRTYGPWTGNRSYRDNNGRPEIVDAQEDSRGHWSVPACGWPMNDDEQPQLSDEARARLAEIEGDQAPFVPTEQGGKSEAKKEPVASHSSADTSVLLLPKIMLNKGPQGDGLDFIKKWNVRLDDLIEAFVFDYKLPRDAHKSGLVICLAYVVHGGLDDDGGMPAEVRVYGIKEEDVDKLIPDMGGVFATKVVGCFWESNIVKNKDGKDEEKGMYVLHTCGLIKPGDYKEGEVVKPNLKGRIQPRIIVMHPTERRNQINNAIKKLENEFHATGGSTFLDPPAPANSQDRPAVIPGVTNVMEKSKQDKLNAHNARIQNALVMKHDDEVDGPEGKKVTFKRWLELTKYGCSYCSTDLTPKTTIWLGDFPAHHDCLENIKRVNK